MKPRLPLLVKFFAYIYLSIDSSDKSEKDTKRACTTRVLRSATRGQVIHFNEKKKKCHLCRERMEDFKLTRCVNYITCHGAFCTPCLEKHFKAKLKKERIKRSGDQWVCFLCRGICQCNKCLEDIRGDLIAVKCGSDTLLSKERLQHIENGSNAGGLLTKSTSPPSHEAAEPINSSKQIQPLLANNSQTSEYKDKKIDVVKPSLPQCAEKAYEESEVCQRLQYSELSYTVYPSYAYPGTQLYYQSSYLQPIKVPGEASHPQTGP